MIFFNNWKGGIYCRVLVDVKDGKEYLFYEYLKVFCYLGVLEGDLLWF